MNIKFLMCLLLSLSLNLQAEGLTIFPNIFTKTENKPIISENFENFHNFNNKSITEVILNIKNQAEQRLKRIENIRNTQKTKKLVENLSIEELAIVVKIVNQINKQHELNKLKPDYTKHFGYTVIPNYRFNQELKTHNSWSDREPKILGGTKKTPEEIKSSWANKFQK